MVEISIPFDNSKPLISVAMPIYNAGKYLRPAVLSIVNQTITDWELFVIDDGSTDNALNDIADIQDNRIKIIKDGLNKGLAARLNQAIDLAQGHYFARMDQDDISYPERFAKQINVLVSDTSLDLVSVRAIKISMQDKPIGCLSYASSHSKITAAPWRGFYMAHPTWMGRTEWFRKHKYAAPAPYLCEDQELLLRTHADSKFLSLNEILFAYRVRDNIPLKKLAKTRFSVFKMQCKYFLGEGDLANVLLAFATLIIRLGLDFFRNLFPTKLSDFKLDKHDDEQWSKVSQIVNS
jgi:glycosyltransferase involved in cell wall biosynthesis